MVEVNVLLARRPVLVRHETYKSQTLLGTASCVVLKVRDKTQYL